jgi:hypothetical protein
MDLLIDFSKTASGSDAVVVFVDRLSKMIHEVATTKSVTAERLPRIYDDAVFKHHDIPDSIVSDRDPRFTSPFWRELRLILGMRLSVCRLRVTYNLTVKRKMPTEY